MLAIASQQLRTALRPVRPLSNPGPEYGYGNDQASAMADYNARRLVWCQHELDDTVRSRRMYQLLFATATAAFGYVAYKMYKVREQEKSTGPQLSVVK